MTSTAVIRQIRQEQDRISKIETLAISGCVLMGLDAITTTFALSQIEGTAEMNPIMAWLIAQTGLAGFAIIKTFIGSLVLLVLAHIGRSGSVRWKWMARNWRFKPLVGVELQKSAYRRLKYINLLMLAVVCWNVSAITFIHPM